MRRSDPIAHPDLVAEIEAFAARTGLARSRIGREALGDPSFVADLHAGRQCLPRTITRLRDWMAQRDLDARRRGP